MKRERGVRFLAIAMNPLCTLLMSMRSLLQFSK